MQPKQTSQLTVRRVPIAVERMLRRRARAEGKSLNQVAIEALARGAGAPDEAASGRPVTRFHDLDQVFGTWIEDPEIDAALAEQRTIDASAWK